MTSSADVTTEDAEARLMKESWNKADEGKLKQGWWREAETKLMKGSWNKADEERWSKANEAKLKLNPSGPEENMVCDVSLFQL